MSGASGRCSRRPAPGVEMSWWFISFRPGLLLHPKISGFWLDIRKTLTTIYSRGKIGFRTHHRVEAIACVQDTQR